MQSVEERGGEHAVLPDLVVVSVPARRRRGDHHFPVHRPHEMEKGTDRARVGNAGPGAALQPFAAGIDQNQRARHVVVQEGLADHRLADHRSLVLQIRAVGQQMMHAVRVEAVRGEADDQHPLTAHRARLVAQSPKDLALFSRYDDGAGAAKIGELET